MERETEGIERRKQMWKEDKVSLSPERTARQHGAGLQSNPAGSWHVTGDRVTVAQSGLCTSGKGPSPSLDLCSAPKSWVKGDLGRRVDIRTSTITLPWGGGNRVWDTRQQRADSAARNTAGAEPWTWPS